MRDRRDAFQGMVDPVGVVGRAGEDKDLFNVCPKGLCFRTTEPTSLALEPPVFQYLKPPGWQQYVTATISLCSYLLEETNGNIIAE